VTTDPPSSGVANCQRSLPTARAARLAAARFSMPLRLTRTAAAVIAPCRCRAWPNICAGLLVTMMSVPEVEPYLNHWAIRILPGPYQQMAGLYAVEGHRFCVPRRGRPVQKFHIAWLAPGDIP
jgi:hypothetical protein